MRVVVTGATGNVGSHLLRELLASGEVSDLVGISRRPPTPDVFPSVRWVQMDIFSREAGAELTRHVRGADVVVHLAWLIQPSRSRATMRATNVTG